MVALDLPLVLDSEIKSAKRLLFMSHLALGDFVYHGAVLSALKEKYPHLEVDIWMDDCRDRSKMWHKERSATLNSWVTQTRIANVVFPIAKGNSDRETLIRRAKRRNYDIIFYVAALRTDRFAHFAHRISKRAILLGNMPDSLFKQYKHFLTFRHIKRRFNIDTVNTKVHILQKYLGYYSKCFGELELAPENQYGLAINLPPESEQSALTWLVDNRVDLNAKKVLINPISSSRKRDLGGDSLNQLILTIIETYPEVHILINVPPSSIVGMNALLKSFSLTREHNCNISVFTAPDDFFMLPAMIQLCDFLITVETSLMHIASILNKPQMAIMRTKTEHWQPLRADDIYWCDGVIKEIDNNAFIKRAMSCLNTALES